MHPLGEVGGGFDDALRLGEARIVLGHARANRFRRIGVDVERLAIEIGETLRLSASVTTTKCQPCWFDPVGACRAMAMQRSSTAVSTGREKSRRLRTERVVVSRWSAAARSMAPPLAS
jgi:hypothetical protein